MLALLLLFVFTTSDFENFQCMIWSQQGRVSIWIFLKKGKLKDCQKKDFQKLIQTRNLPFQGLPVQISVENWAPKVIYDPQLTIFERKASQGQSGESNKQ